MHPILGDWMLFARLLRLTGFVGYIEDLGSLFSPILHPVLSGGQAMVQVNASFGGIVLITSYL